MKIEVAHLRDPLVVTVPDRWQGRCEGCLATPIMEVVKAGVAAEVTGIDAMRE
jgi:hypothetical protein